MLLGTFEHSIDDKGRLNIPAKFRAKLGEVVYVSKGFDGCLEIRKPEDFEKWSNELLSHSNTKKSTRLLSREILGNTSDVNFDKVGRISFPSNLLTIANIKKEVLIIGQGNKLEIWDVKSYSDYLKENSASLEAVAEEFGGTQ
ncbi:division/cell wall cluster transcriptional repressor MraZ [Spiroplasma endosymbiont of Othius punctulatus]|uniref:division/cell wall cluster transcriptional repressor MraZ n=1 Tax=Spiroplasma endosymbiont of Othius punctulatus TaxID=3066289 RepID=UPI0030D25CA0